MEKNMNRLLIGVVASTLLAGASVSFAEFAGGAAVAAEPAPAAVMLQLNNGQQVKVMVPKSEASKLKDVKSGDKAIFLTVPAAAAAYSEPNS
jgi:hypothetical protein